MIQDFIDAEIIDNTKIQLNICRENAFTATE